MLNDKESCVTVSDLEKNLDLVVPPVSSVPVAVDEHDRILPEAYFHHMICLERKRAERSRNPFLLMLLDTGKSLLLEKKAKVLEDILSALALSTRDTDVTGWYRGHQVLGVMFTEISPEFEKSILATILLRLSSALRDCLTLEQFSQVTITFHLFPEHWDEHHTPSHPNGSALYPDLHRDVARKKWARAMKRLMDIIGSLFAILIFSPLLLAIAAAVKLTSRGSILFRQQRVGQYGTRFTFLKFRSMYLNNSSDIHKEYVRKLIAGQAEKKTGGVFKLTDDPRITSVGRWLRRTSLDELPQFLNVLRGDMSLVGPRPPLPYEVEAYDVWHRRRLMDAKPGITGLWQVNGRCRTRFDEMVRLDLQYARRQSLLLDLKILLRTPAAVFSGDGAY
jgi:exopolysaccharide biosynthesis polyprenyl glycosylphosphotransferase